MASKFSQKFPQRDKVNQMYCIIFLLAFLISPPFICRIKPMWKTSLLQQYFLHHLESKQFWSFAKSFDKHKDVALLWEQGVKSWDCVFCLNEKQLQYLRPSTGKPWPWQQWSQSCLSCRFVKVNFNTDLFFFFLTALCLIINRNLECISARHEIITPKKGLFLYSTPRHLSNAKCSSYGLHPISLDSNCFWQQTKKILHHHAHGSTVTHF